MFAHFGSLLLELLKFANYTREQMRDAVDVEGEDRARQAYAQDRGVLFFTGHFGYWEIQAIVEPLHGPPISGAGPSARQPRDSTTCSNASGRGPGNVGDLPSGERCGRCFASWRANHGVGRCIIDQHLHTPDAVFVDFFRRPAATHVRRLRRLRCAPGAPVIPVFALPLPHGSISPGLYEHPVDPPRADTADAVRDYHAALH
jgi:KDO2-lipid IV(A) lauroyltransferase